MLLYACSAALAEKDSERTVRNSEFSTHPILGPRRVLVRSPSPRGLTPPHAGANCGKLFEFMRVRGEIWGFSMCVLLGPARALCNPWRTRGARRSKGSFSRAETIARF